MANSTAIRVILYDLDGTVYNDTAQFDYYISRIASRFPKEREPELFRQFRAASRGEDPRLVIGRFYHAPSGMTVELDRERRVARVYDGSEEVARDRWPDLPETPQHDGYDLLNVGDLWGISSAMGRLFGLPQEELRACFTETRAFMAGSDFQIQPIPGLAETMRMLRGKVGQVLATNSPHEASQVILQKTGMLDLMDTCYYSSNKPLGLPHLLERIREDFGAAPGAVLSVGDNYHNEVIAARRLGTQTAFIDPHGHGGPEDADIYVRHMTELVPFLRSLATEGGGLA